MLRCRLFPITSTHSFKELWPVAELTCVAAAGSYTAATECPPQCCALPCTRVPTPVPPGHVRPRPRQVARH